MVPSTPGSRRGRRSSRPATPPEQDGQLDGRPAPPCPPFRPLAQPTADVRVRGARRPRHRARAPTSVSSARARPALDGHPRSTGVAATMIGRVAPTSVAEMGVGRGARADDRHWTPGVNAAATAARSRPPPSPPEPARRPRRSWLSAVCRGSPAVRRRDPRAATRRARPAQRQPPGPRRRRSRGRGVPRASARTARREDPPRESRSR